MAREIRVTFTDKEEDLYNYILSKSSRTAFLKDLAKIEMKRENNIIDNTVNEEYIGLLKQNNKAIIDLINSSSENTNKIVNEFKSIFENIQSLNVTETKTQDNVSVDDNDYDFSIDDILGNN